MSNLRRYNVYMGNGIAKANSNDDAEEIIGEIFNLTVNDLIMLITSAVIEKYEIEEDDTETLEKKMNEMTFAELFEISD